MPNRLYLVHEGDTDTDIHQNTQSLAQNICPTALSVKPLRLLGLQCGRLIYDDSRIMLNYFGYMFHNVRKTPMTMFLTNIEVHFNGKFKNE